MIRRAVVAVGGNLGDADRAVRLAMDALDAARAIHVVARSTIFTTVALTLHGWDDSRPRYANAVCLVRTALGPYELLDVLHRIENAFGRVRRERWGDRTLDLDLIDMDGVVLHSPRLTVPHPRAHERLFVLDPWLQVEPSATLGGVRIRSLAARAGANR